LTNPDGVTEIPHPSEATNGHERYPNVIVAHWPRPGTGQLVAQHCLTRKATIYGQ
jgi:hypothetical protein